MARLILFSVLLAILGCAEKRNGEESPVQSDTLNGNALMVPESFFGNWINKAYLDKISESRSTKEAQSVSDLCLVSIIRLSGDSVVMRTIWNFHEGGDEPVLKMMDSSYAKSISKYDWSDPYTVKVNSNGLLTISYSDKTAEYVKYGDGTQYADYTELVNEILFSGNYILDTNAVELLNTGEIIGLNDYVSYKPNEDYADAGMNFDKIYLTTKEGDEHTFGYDFTKETLEIFHLDCETYDELDSTFCVVHARGDVLYRLVRL